MDAYVWVLQDLEPVSSLSTARVSTCNDKVFGYWRRRNFYPYLELNKYKLV